MADDLLPFLGICGVLGVVLIALGVYAFLRLRRKFAAMGPPATPPGHPPVG